MSFVHVIPDFNFFGVPRAWTPSVVEVQKDHLWILYSGEPLPKASWLWNICLLVPQLHWGLERGSQVLRRFHSLFILSEFLVSNLIPGSGGGFNSLFVLSVLYQYFLFYPSFLFWILIAGMAGEWIFSPMETPMWGRCLWFFKSLFSFLFF